MSSWSEAGVAGDRRRARVLRGVPAPVATAGPLDAELVPPPPASSPASTLRAVDEGYEAGFARGYEEGLDGARAVAAAEAAEALARLERALAALAGAQRALQNRQALELAGLEAELVVTAFTLAEAVLGRELQLATAPGADAVTRALALAPPAVPAVVRLHPDDLKEVEIASWSDPGRPVTFVPDASIEPGGCVVDAGDCRVDAQLGPALERARAALFGEQE